MRLLSSKMDLALQYILGGITIGSAAIAPNFLSWRGWVLRGVGILAGVVFLKISHRIFYVFKQLETRKDNLNDEIELLQLEQESRAQYFEFQVKAANDQIKQEREIFEEECLLKRQEIESAILSQQQYIQSQIEAANDELEQDKQQFLLSHQESIERYEQRIEFLESDLLALQSQLIDYERPQLPQGIRLEDMIARRVIEFLLSRKVTCDFVSGWIDEAGYILLRIKPRQHGEKEIKKHLNHLQIELNLSEPPRTATLHGSVQLWLKPQELATVPEVPGSELNSSSSEPESLEPLEIRGSKFTEPIRTLEPFGAIKEIEREWVYWLWNHHHPKPIRNRNTIIKRVWGASNGGGDKYVSARDRLGQIMNDLGINVTKIY